MTLFKVFYWNFEQPEFAFGGILDDAILELSEGKAVNINPVNSAGMLS